MNGNIDSGKRYLKLRHEVDSAAIECGRKPEEILLIAVSKHHAWNEVCSIYEAGCNDFGESRIQEAIPKILEAPPEVQWHFIGPLQKNKIKKAIGRFSLIHSVDTLELAQAVSQASIAASIQTKVLIQVNTSGESSKQGLKPEDLQRNFEAFLGLFGLQIEGLMTMAPLTDDAQIIRRCFSECRQLRDRLQEQYQGFHLPHLSMGMSNDYRYAIQEGATLLRIGSILYL